MSKKLLITAIVGGVTLVVVGGAATAYCYRQAPNGFHEWRCWNPFAEEQQVDAPENVRLFEEEHLDRLVQSGVAFAGRLLLDRGQSPTCGDITAMYLSELAEDRLHGSHVDPRWEDLARIHRAIERLGYSCD